MPVARCTSRVTRRCNGWLARRYVAGSHPARTHASSIPACLPEQLCSSLCLCCEAAIDSASSGQPGGFRRASASSPARSSTARTVPTWIGSPLCDAAITATSRSGSASAIAVSETVACSGFMHDRA